MIFVWFCFGLDTKIFVYSRGSKVRLFYQFQTKNRRCKCPSFHWKLTLLSLFPPCTSCRQKYKFRNFCFSVQTFTDPDERSSCIFYGIMLRRPAQHLTSVLMGCLFRTLLLALPSEEKPSDYLQVAICRISVISLFMLQAIYLVGLFSCCEMTITHLVYSQHFNFNLSNSAYNSRIYFC